MPAQSTTNREDNLIYPGPDGRQTRIDFFRNTKSGKADTHILHSRRQVGDWWSTVTGWFRSSHKEEDHHLDEFRKFLESRNYSAKTCHSYIFMLKKFFDYMDERETREITLGLIEDYNYDFFVIGRYSRSYQLQFINGVSLYLEYAHDVKVNLKNLRRTESRR